MAMTLKQVFTTKVCTIVKQRTNDENAYIPAPMNMLRKAAVGEQILSIKFPSIAILRWPFCSPAPQQQTMYSRWNLWAASEI
jgi:hypothetical protein